MSVLGLILFNAAFYPMLFLYFVFSVPFLTAFVTFFSFFLSRRRAMKLYRQVVGYWALGIVRVLTFPFVQVRYRDYAKSNGKGPFIFVCNHRSFSDGFLMSLPTLWHESVLVVNIWPFRMPLLGIVAKFIGYLSVNEMAFEEFSKRACDFLKQGVSIVTFPEGTRSGNRALRQFHGAIFRVALQAQCPIVPICISGSENIPARGSFLMHPGTIKMHRLPALQWEEYRNLNPFRLKNKVRDIIAGELAVMEGK